ncbi:MAG: hypothetical protein ABID84_00740 [Chloroflexota bacterium]
MGRKQNIPSWQTWGGAGKLALIAICFTLLVVFAAENFVVVEVRLIAFSLETRLVWAVLLAAALGFSVGLLTARFRS